MAASKKCSNPKSGGASFSFAEKANLKSRMTARLAHPDQAEAESGSVNLQAADAMLEPLLHLRQVLPVVTIVCMQQYDKSVRRVSHTCAGGSGRTCRTTWRSSPVHERATLTRGAEPWFPQEPLPF